MKQTNIATALKWFIDNDKNGVFVIHGEWGVGKTHLASSVLLECVQSKNGLKMSHLSLFGLEGIEDVKKNIIFNSVSYEKKIKKLKLKINKALHGFSYFLSKVPFATRYIPPLDRFFHKKIFGMILILDDFERYDGNHGKLMGFISELKEKRDCKIILVMNQSKLESDDYIKNREKVVDYEYRFDPSVDESIRIGLLSEDPAYSPLIKSFKKLNCPNIRIIRGAKKNTDAAKEAIKDAHPTTALEVLTLISLFTYCKTLKSQEGRTPTLKDIVNYYDLLSLSSDDSNEPDSAFLELFFLEHNLENTGKLSYILAKHINNGFINPADSDLVEEIKLRDKLNKNNELNNSLNEAWACFRKDFKSNQDIFIKKLHSSVLSVIDTISYANISEAIHALNYLDEEEKADELIFSFIEENREAIEKNGPGFIFGMIPASRKSQKLIKEINSVSKEKEHMLFDEIMKRAFSLQFINKLEISRINEATYLDFYNVLKAGDWEGELIHIAEGLRMLRQKVDNPETLLNIQKAIDTIKQENKLNAYRVERLIESN